MSWDSFKQNFLDRAAGLDADDRALVLARMQRIYGDDPIDIAEAHVFMTRSLGPIGTKPVEALSDHLGRVRLLDFLKQCREKHL